MKLALAAVAACGIFALGWFFGDVQARALIRQRGEEEEEEEKTGGGSWWEEEDDLVEDIDWDEMDRKDLPLRRLRKAETVIMRRTSRILLVLERTTYTHNYSAVMRTAEAMGVQNVWVIMPPSQDDPFAGGVTGHQKKRNEKEGVLQAERERAQEEEEHNRFAKRAVGHLWIREFDTTAACVAALREEGRTLWVTDLSQAAESLYSRALSAKGGTGVPKKLALAFGTESTGASPTLLRAADKRVYLPLNGFADSLNLSVAAAMITQRVLAMCGPSVVGDMDDGDRRRLREEWYPQLAKSPEQQLEFARMIDDPPRPLSDLRVVNEERRLPRKQTVAKQKLLGDAYEVGIGH